MEKNKSFWFLGSFILFLAIAIILFFRIGLSYNKINLGNEDNQVLINQEKINEDEFIFLKKANDNQSEVNSLNERERSFLEPIKSAPLNLLFFGDLMLDRHVAERLKNKHVSFLLNNFSEESNFWEKFDLIGANLEGAVTNKGEYYAPFNLYDFAFSPDRIEELKDFNFSYFALANNHFSDQGKRGVEETRENLDRLGFNYSGATDAKIDKHSRFDQELKGLRLSLISLSMVYDNFPLKEAEELIKDAALNNDLVIVNIHWGNEYEHYFNRYQKERGYALIEAGADIIIGHHPHVVQGMEIYNNKPIFYSLGNFIFDQYFSAATQEGLALDLLYQAGELTVNFLPFNSVSSAPKLLKEEAKNNFLEKFITWSQINEDAKAQIKEGYLKLNF